MAVNPLRKAVEAYAGLGSARFHMPGHKGTLDPLDVTEVPGVDNLQHPIAAILESEHMAAGILKAKDAFYLVNGSTVGDLAMLALLGSGKRVLLGRNCHKSVINGLAFADHDAIPLFPDENGVFSPAEIGRLLDETPCDAVFITSPTYRGYVSPIDEIAYVCHKHNALLLVDCAHGAHLAFSDNLPPVPSAADMWVISSHKTLEAMTQTAVLLVGESCPFSRSRIQRVLNMFQSTSPSYPLMLSIEKSVLSHPNWDWHINRIREFLSRLRTIKGVNVYGDRRDDHDITRINIGLEGVTGYELSRRLESMGIYPEMEDLECVTLITSPSDRGPWYDRVIDALIKIGPREGRVIYHTNVIKERISGEKVCSVRNAIMGEFERVDYQSSIGRVSAGTVGCYPPGIAILFPGERISERAIGLIDSERYGGADIFGLDDGLVAVVKE
ncbi:MAG: aminotransferase class V-fold PLP-dependent enzyme [Clostridia bacterium]|nr:aminotransferase class V-fold PLP-dependent enzyme [Clostridia bacterium]